jgi:hypothetical protein
MDPDVEDACASMILWYGGNTKLWRCVVAVFGGGAALGSRSPANRNLSATVAGLVRSNVVTVEASANMRYSTWKYMLLKESSPTSTSIELRNVIGTAMYAAPELSLGAATKGYVNGAPLVPLTISMTGRSSTTTPSSSTRSCPCARTSDCLP